MMFDSGASCGDVADSGWARPPLMGVITSRDHARAATGDRRPVRIAPMQAMPQQMRAAHKHLYLLASVSFRRPFSCIGKLAQLRINNILLLQ